MNEAIVCELMDLHGPEGHGELLDLVESFVQEAEGQLRQLVSLAAGQEASEAEIRRVAHSLKGAAAQLGAQTLARLAGELEEVCGGLPRARHTPSELTLTTRSTGGGSLGIAGILERMTTALAFYAEAFRKRVGGAN